MQFLSRRLQEGGCEIGTGKASQGKADTQAASYALWKTGAPAAGGPGLSRFPSAAPSRGWPGDGV